MLAALLSLFTGSLGKYIAIGLGVLTILGSAYGYLKLKEHDAAETARAQFNQVQLEEAQKENAAYQEQLKQLETYSITQAQQIDKLNTDLETTTANANKIIDDNMKKADKIPLDPLFNSVLNQLNGVK